MKKKVLFVIGNMETGGIQKSLSELIYNIYDKYDITLCCVNKTGHYLSLLPENVRVITAGKSALVTELPLSEAKSLGILYYILRLISVAWSKYFTKKLPFLFITKLLTKSLGTYDAAIAFSQPLHEKLFNNISNELVLNCCTANTKATFVHCDFENYGGDTPYTRSIYKRFDKIACVSDSVGKIFKKCMPDVSDKVYTVLNTHNYEYILKSANDNPIEYSGSPVVITVSRLSKEKGLLRCLDCFVKLREKLPQIQWHIVGGGPLEALLKSEIKQKSLENTVILHGNQDNPYRFMKNADLFLLPSYHEASPMVFGEAACLKLPVLTTDTLSAVEMIENRKSGMVCAGDNIYDALDTMLTGDMTKQIKFENICSNEAAINQFDRLIEQMR